MFQRQTLSGRKAILYVRVSSDEQANEGYSLRAQKESLTKFCRQQGIQVLRVFEDDGYSAKNFDRPAWNELSAWAQANRGGADPSFGADLLLFTKWSRFGRNISEAFTWIDRLRLELGVEPQAIEQWVSYEDPNHVYLLAINLAEPDAANRWLSINTKQGMRRAQREGRWTTQAPFGYVTSKNRDERGVIYPDPDRAELVRFAFDLAAHRHDLTIADIRLKVRQRALQEGTRFTVSRSQFYRLLRGVVYTGRIEVPAWKGEPAEIVQGLHTPIVEDEVFDAVQARLAGTRKQRRAPIRPEIILRGHLLCPQCGRLMTGGGSKSQSGKRYWYYHCVPRYGCKVRQRASHVEEAFVKLLGQARISRDTRVLFEALIDEDRARDHAAREKEMQALQEQVATLEEKAFAADEALVVGRIDDAAYQRLTSRYTADRLKLEARLAEIRTWSAQAGEALRFYVRMLSEVQAVWKRSGPDVRSALLGSIFPEKLVFENGVVRTASPENLFGLFASDRGQKEGRRRSSDQRRPIRLPG